MPIVTVTKSDASKSGAPRIYFDNKHNWQDAIYCSKVAQPSVGMVINADLTSSEFPKGSGKMLWHLNAWKQADSAPPPNAKISAENVQKSLSGYYSAPAPKGWNIDSGDLSRLASNLMASAIEAGLVKEPHQLMVWAAGAYRAAESLRSGKVEDFNDEITITGPDPAERQGFDDDRRFDGDPGPGYTDNPAADDIPF